jgi:Rhs element Vgr protein
MAFANITVKIDGNDLAEQKIRTGDIVVSQPLWGHHWFSVECLSLVAKDASVTGGASEALDGLRQTLGKPLELELRWGSGQKYLFRGVVTAIKASRHHLGAYAVVVEGHSPTVQMDGVRRNRIWTDATTKDIVTAVIADYNEFCEMSASTSRKYPTTVQHGETDYDFVLRLCQHERLWAWYDGEKFKIADTPEGASRKLNLRGSGDGTLTSFAVKLGTRPGKFHARAWDRTGDNALSQATDEVSIGDALHDHVQAAVDASDEVFNAQGDLVLERHPVDASGLEAELQAQKHGWVGGLVVAEGESDDPGLATGGRLEVEGMSAADGGRYIVTGVTHFIQGDGSGYRNTFTAVPEDGAYPPCDRLRPPAPSLWGAVVRDTDDPDALGRVRVEFHHSVAAGSGDTLSPWLRVAQNHSGEEWGSFVLPEIGDEVVVAALEGDQEDLVVLGSVPNGSSTNKMGPIKVAEDAVGATDMAQGLAKVFVTKAGNQILIKDQAGAETIEITSPGAQNQIRLTLDGDPRIELESDGDVSITAKGAISLKSDADITLDAKGGIELKSAGDLKLDAKGKADLKAGMAASVKGMEVKVEGGGKVTCNPAGVEVKGALIRLN